AHSAQFFVQDDAELQFRVNARSATAKRKGSAPGSGAGCGGSPQPTIARRAAERDTRAAGATLFLRPSRVKRYRHVIGSGAKGLPGDAGRCFRCECPRAIERSFAGAQDDAAFRLVTQALRLLVLVIWLTAASAFAGPRETIAKAALSQ